MSATVIDLHTAVTEARVTSMPRLSRLTVEAFHVIDALQRLIDAEDDATLAEFLDAYRVAEVRFTAYLAPIVEIVAARKAAE